MKPLVFVLLLVTLLLQSPACHTPAQPRLNSRVFVVQPFDDLPGEEAKIIYNALKKINPKTILRKAMPLPSAAFYLPRNRYRADSLISYLNHRGSADTVVIGLTSKDISATKGNIPDWGIMGLGFQPGNACVVSTFRLSKTGLSRQFYKVALHEMAHTEGLPHCKNKGCFMRDAEGGNHLDEETGFCSTCRSFLQSKGWQLP